LENPFAVHFKGIWANRDPRIRA